MAGGTGSLHRSVIHLFRRKSTQRRTRVAERAFIARHAGRGSGWNMVAYLARHAQISTGMAGLASSLGDSRMGICEVGRPDACRMTNLTTHRSWHMIARFDIDIRIGIGVAGSAGSCRHAGVGERRDQRQPCRIAMASTTGQRTGRDVYRGLAGSLDAIVTTAAIGVAHAVREGCRQPGRRRLVANVTGLAGRDMRRGFCLGVRAQIIAVVTTRAVADDD